MSTCNHDGSFVTEKELTKGFGKGSVRNLEIENVLDLRIPPGKSGSHDHQVRFRFEVSKVETLGHGNLSLREKVAHGRIDPVVGSRDLVPLFLQHRRQRGHTGSTNPDEMNMPDRILQ